jgi:Uma2 family endonuclease
MRAVSRVDQVEYPESDGHAMGETDLHRDWMVRILDIFRYRYRGQRVYVASNLLVYYEEGVPRKFVVPDDFVVLDCDPRRRRVFKTWKEGKAPQVVFEVTSRSTRRDDESLKPQVYERIGVQEYFLYDPSGEYLRPPLQAFRFRQGQGFVAVAPDDDGSLTCQTLDIRASLERSQLVLADLRSGQRLLTEAEAERAARRAAEARVAELQAELARLHEKH